MFFRCRQGVLQKEKTLEYRQTEQCKTRADVSSGPCAAGFQLCMLCRGDFCKYQRFITDGEAVPGFDGRTVGLHLFSVYCDTASGESIENFPFAVVITDKDTVDALYRPVCQMNISMTGTPQHVFPVGEGICRFISAVEDITPDLRLIPLTEHGAYAADQNPQRQKRQNVFARIDDDAYHFFQIPNPPFH